ncbi:plasma membrane protein Pth11-like protein [Podospora didyma]|uniref:Plasma membrane protein Pth11-like protein n=1 Tax=Podospora didyma TaxID=330526 RepID=A0AAE0U3P7_9PEZI|nr:plasma membrane protein Pth11-like protein [Podospora didyma]
MPAQAYYQTPGHAIAAGVALTMVDIIAVASRFWARKRNKQQLKADDWLIVPAALLTMGIGIDMVYGVSQHGQAAFLEIPPDFNGNPLQLVTPQLAATSKTQFVFTLLLPLALGFIKLSILMFYRRIFSATTASKRHRFLSGMVVFVTIWTLAFLVANLSQCGLNLGASIFGSAEDIETNCPGTMFLDLALCITDFVTDILIFCIPAPLIWRLNMSTANKLTAIAIFLLGSATIVASILRLVMQVQIVTVGFAPDADPILTSTQFLYWGMIECGVGIFATCLPVFQVLFRKLPWASLVQSVRGTLSSANRSYNTSSTSQQSIYTKRTVDVTSHPTHWNTSSTSVAGRSVNKSEHYPVEDFPVELQVREGKNGNEAV